MDQYNVKSQTEKWIEQLNQKQVAAFHYLFDEFYRYLVLYALKWVDRLEVAEDIVQDLFTQIWERDTQYSSYYGFKNFLYNSVKNASLDYLRHKEVEGKYTRYVLRNFEEKEEFELEIMKNEIYRKLYLTVEELPHRCQEVFQYYLQGKKNAEIAAMLQISELTVKAHKKNAIKFIQERLGHFTALLILFRMI